MSEGKPSRTARAKGVAARGQQWVETADPASKTGVTVGWFRRYAAADGQLYAVLLTAYVFLTVLPAALVMASYMDTNPDALSNHMINRLGLRGATADLIHGVLSGTSGHKLSAALIALGSVAFFGLGIGRVLQLAHSRAWGIDLGKARIRDQGRYTSVLLAILAAILVYTFETKLLQGQPKWIGWAVAPLWLAALLFFFVWAPRLLLHHRVTRRQVVPGAVFTVLGLLGTRALSQFLLVNWLEWYGKNYGGFGIVMALFFWITIPATILVLAAALSPALAHRRDLREGRTPTLS
jgi:uncharacterized BrkB/YihY/UPF0761 family membrane protein